jgi:hypothetical protein
MAYVDKQKERENKKKYYLEHREIILNRARVWNLAHPERVKEIRRSFYYKRSI